MPNIYISSAAVQSVQGKWIDSSRKSTSKQRVVIVLLYSSVASRYSFEVLVIHYIDKKDMA